MWKGILYICKSKISNRCAQYNLAKGTKLIQAYKMEVIKIKLNRLKKLNCPTYPEITKNTVNYPECD